MQTGKVMNKVSKQSIMASTPKEVWAVAFACVVSFMGIGLVDPILKSLAHELGATPSQTQMLLTSYLVVTAIAMLITGWVSSHIGAKKTLLVGLVLIIIFAALSGFSNTVHTISLFRAGWGLGNALFIATSLSVIVAASAGNLESAIILYESALGIGIATGPLVGGLLGQISWRGPFFGVSVLMLIAVIAIFFLLPEAPKPEHKQSILEPIRALRYRALLTTGGVGILYNWGFFTLLGFSPFLMNIDSPIRLGFIFFGWGILLAIFAVFVAPVLHKRFGTAVTLYGNLLCLSTLLAVIGIWSDKPKVIIVAVIISGIFAGVNNTLVTTAVMSIAPVENSVASATYGFVRFIGGGLAPWVAGRIVTEWGNVSIPFYIAAGLMALGIPVLATVHTQLKAAEAGEVKQPELDPIDKVESEYRDEVGAVLGSEG
ncbi:MAG: MFS transporter [Micrococcaceae bacterium]